MLILTLRTDKSEAEVGLFNNHKQIAYETWPAHRQLAETIHSKIQSLLDSQDKKWDDLRGVVFYRGPGSFTGLRIGASVANALSYSLDIPAAAAGGKSWIWQGHAALHESPDKRLVLPEYGSPASIYIPRIKYNDRSQS
jgi:tRNA threonylcarbamoyladenosine biosynthesis protein TsaB